MTLGEKLVTAIKCCYGVADSGGIVFCDECPYGKDNECHPDDMIRDLQALSQMAEKKAVICPNCGAYIDK